MDVRVRVELTRSVGSLSDWVWPVWVERGRELDRRESRFENAVCF